MAEDEEVVKEEPEVSSDEDGGIGFKMPHPEETKMKRRRTKGPEDPVPAPKPGAKRKQPSQTASGSSGLPDQLKAAQSFLSALQAFTPQALLQGALKVKDMDKRLAAALEIHAALEEYVHSSPEAAEMAKTLSNTAQKVTDWMECLIPFKDTDGCLHNAKTMDKNEIERINKHLPADCIHSIVMEVGKRLLEAGSGFQGSVAVQDIDSSPRLT